MSFSEYFEQHEEQAFVVKALATAVAITLVKALLPGLVGFLYLILPVVFLVGLRFHAAASGVDAMDLLREHITFLPMIRSEDERRKEVKPWVTYGIILANVLVFYLFESNVSPETISDNLVFLPHKPNVFNVPLSAFTAIFLHASNGHLWGNMTFLWVVGSAVERRVGRLRFSWLYLVTGLIGGFVYILVEFLCHARAGHALGASGAIAGIMGIFAVRCYFKSMIFPIPILGIFSLILPLSLKIRLNSLSIMALFFLSDLSGGVEQLTGSGSMIGHWAHLGGMISGMLIAGYLKLGDDAVEERHLEIGIKASRATTGYQGGERSMQIALDRSPDNTDALLGMARLKTKFNSTLEGKELYEKSLGLLLAERPAEVVEVLREYLGKFLTVPAEALLVSRLAQAMGKAGETGLQISCLERLVEIPGISAIQREKDLYQLGTLLEFTSCFEAAQSCFARFAFEYPESIMAEKARQKAGGEVHRPPQTAVGVTVPPAQLCRACGAAMTIRQSTSGPRQGVPFWVCNGYPACQTFHPVAEAGAAIETTRQEPAPEAERYRLVLDGTIGFTFDPEEVKENLMLLLRCGRDQVERLCRGNPTVLKRGLDHASALRYKEAVSGTGAICTMEKEEVPLAPAAPEMPTQALRSRQAAGTAALAPARPFSCPKCGQVQEKGESCLACGVYFAKVAKLAEREFNGFQDHLESGTGALNRASAAGKAFTRWQPKFTWIAALLVVSFLGCLMVSYGSVGLKPTSAQARLANSALKSQLDLGKPDISEIKRMLAASDFKALDNLYDGYFKQYQKDVLQEGFFQEAYNVFTPKNDLSTESLDLWVATTGSYMAYAARGTYRAQQGFIARGGEYASDTPRSQLDEMQRLHDEAAKDLQLAIAANPQLMPAYSCLIVMAKTSNMPYSAKQILDLAVEKDKRSFYVRHEYIVSLQPRWGGSYGDMSAYAKSASEFSGMNPRLWSLQGAADADRADDQYRAGNYSGAVKLYTKALRFGDRLTWLKYRAACNYYQDKKNEAIADYRRVVSYDPSDRTAQAGMTGAEP
jgi:membrane associated rhomboid family serine protease/tetratricopeptide (TPR) repeat protein